MNVHKRTKLASDAAAFLALSIRESTSDLHERDEMLTTAIAYLTGARESTRASIDILRQSYRTRTTGTS